MCGSSARTDLYGGQLAIAVPTVTETYPNESNIPPTDRRLLDGVRFVCPRPSHYSNVYSGRSQPLSPVLQPLLQSWVADWSVGLHR